MKHKDNKNYLLEFGSGADLRKFEEENSGNPRFGIVGKGDEEIIVNIDDKDINFLIFALSKSGVKSFSHLKETLEDYFMKYYREDKHFGGV